MRFRQAAASALIWLMMIVRTSRIDRSCVLSLRIDLQFGFYSLFLF
jgi:hypothetical protein